ncbi:hypothetical protein JR316_0002641 [Psilocybe cubensis]|uniref:Uncharacterized protein n=2 Tax=Psilocybe cubensis TaxID=181762 RepID=A0ACB8HE21_PSICU|nr:hypothetical protein JR316_0002641 [Psilocybe cubensis]KAH9485726.1 hypothetical protein JR316_0002641 [Psilocybe cubensis]
MSESDGFHTSTNLLEQPVETVVTPTRHSIYYFELVIFRVQDVLFKVPKHGFMIDGTIFPDMFSLPVSGGAMPQGSCDENPIMLPVDISQTDFHGFLLLLYPYFDRERETGVATYEELVGALKLATMWEFDEVRKKAIFRLSPILTERPTVEQILLAKEYDVKSWLRDGYLTLIRKSDLSIQQLCDPFQLDWKTIARVFAIQSYSRHSTWRQTIFLEDEFQYPSSKQVEEYLDTVFEDEFKVMRVDVLE